MWTISCRSLKVRFSGLRLQLQFSDNTECPNLFHCHERLNAYKVSNTAPISFYCFQYLNIAYLNPREAFCHYVIGNWPLSRMLISSCVSLMKTNKICPPQARNPATFTLPPVANFLLHEWSRLILFKSRKPLIINIMIFIYLCSWPHAAFRSLLTSTFGHAAAHTSR